MAQAKSAGTCEVCDGELVYAEDGKTVLHKDTGNTRGRGGDPVDGSRLTHPARPKPRSS